MVDRLSIQFGSLPHRNIFVGIGIGVNPEGCCEEMEIIASGNVLYLMLRSLIGSELIFLVFTFSAQMGATTA